MAAMEPSKLLWSTYRPDTFYQVSSQLAAIFDLRSERVWAWKQFYKIVSISAELSMKTVS